MQVYSLGTQYVDVYVLILLYKKKKYAHILSVRAYTCFPKKKYVRVLTNYTEDQYNTVGSTQQHQLINILHA
jgi:hypothetical protein